MTFDDLNLHTPLKNALQDLGYSQPTSIQGKVFSVMMSGKDVLGIAQTGTGKTFAYLLPCLRMWKYSKSKYPQILIVVPTRELVIQIVGEVEKLTKYMNVKVAGAYGGTNIKSQMLVVSEGLDVVVATPGRLLDLALQGTLQLKAVQRFVIDEVDEMLNLGFRTQLSNIMELLPPRRQNLMFSATLTDEVERLIEHYFNDPVKIEAAPVGTPLENIVQSVYKVPNFNTKINLLEWLLTHHKEMTKVLIFAATKKLADDLYERIEPKFPSKVGVIHSNKDQNNRNNTVKAFKSDEIHFLIATDIIARGIDISEVTHVINFDTPEVQENYMHRIGRTGRADKKGISITFVTKKEDELQAAIEELMNYKIPEILLPAEVVVSKVLTEDEIPKVQMKNILVKLPKKEDSGGALHEKSAKNQKVNNKIRRKEQMKIKYGKPKTRGMKKKG